MACPLGRVNTRYQPLIVESPVLVMVMLAVRPLFQAFTTSDTRQPPVGGALLGGAVLGGAVLGGAVLGGAVLGGAVLGGAVLGGALLGGRVLGGAELGGGELPSRPRNEMA